MSDDTGAWNSYLLWKSKKFNITTEQVEELIGYCFGSKVTHYITQGQCTQLLDGLMNKEVDKALRRTIKLLDNLDELIKLRKNADEADLDFMMTGGHPVKTGNTEINFNLKPSELKYV